MRVKRGTLVAVLDVRNPSWDPPEDLLGIVTYWSSSCQVRFQNGSLSFHDQEELIPLAQTLPEEIDKPLEELLRKHLPEVIISLVRRQATTASRTLAAAH